MTLCNFNDKFKFTARWITGPGCGIPNRCLQFRKEFLCGHPGGKKLLRIAAESYYRLFLNGQFIGQGPVRGSRTIHFFDAWDVTGHLHAGKNVLALEVQSMNEHENFLSWPAGCAVLAEIPGVVKTDPSWIVRPAPEWVSTQALYTFQQGFRTELDLRKKDDRWKMPGFCPDGTWSQSGIFDSPDLARKELRPRGIPPLRESLRVPVLLKSAVILPEVPADDEDIADVLNREKWLPSPEGHADPNGSCAFRSSPDGGIALVWDFHGSCSGFFEAEVETAEEALATVTYGEELWNGRVRASFPRGNHPNTFTDVYHLRAGKNFLTTPFLSRGGNLVQLTVRGTGTDVRIASPVFRERRYPCDFTDFSCSDGLLNRIWDMCRETLSVCMTDTFEDCPWRERSFWVNDLVVENAASFAVAGAGPLQKHCIELLFSQQYPSGWVPGVVPVRYDEVKMPLVLAPTNLFLFVIMHDYCMASGDMATVQKFLPNLERILETVESLRGEDGLAAPPKEMSNLYDWGYELQHLTFNGCRETLFNSLYIHAMKLFMELAGLTGQKVTRSLYEARIARTEQALRKNTADHGGLLLDDVMKYDDSGHTEPTQITSELSLAFALCSGIWDSGEEQRFLEAICSGKFHTPDLYLQTPVMLQLARHGRIAEVLRRIRKYWGRFASAGVRNFPEVGIIYTGRKGIWDNTSFCHGFTSGPAILLQRYILGIMPTRVGYEQFSFAPAPGDLEQASGSVHTPRGVIRVSWKKAGAAGLSADLTVPTGCTCILKEGGTLGSGTHHLERICPSS